MSRLSARLAAALLGTAALAACAATDAPFNAASAPPVAEPPVAAPADTDMSADSSSDTMASPVLRLALRGGTVEAQAEESADAEDGPPVETIADAPYSSTPERGGESAPYAAHASLSSHVDGSSTGKVFANWSRNPDMEEEAFADLGSVLDAAAAAGPDAEAETTAYDVASLEPAPAAPEPAVEPEPAVARLALAEQMARLDAAYPDDDADPLGLARPYAVAALEAPVAPAPSVEPAPVAEPEPAVAPEPVVAPEAMPEPDFYANVKPPVAPTPADRAPAAPSADELAPVSETEEIEPYVVAGTRADGDIPPAPPTKPAAEAVAPEPLRVKTLEDILRVEPGAPERRDGVIFVPRRD